MLSFPHSHWLVITVFLNYNTSELQGTSEVSVVPVSTSFAIVRCCGNKMYFKLTECIELYYAENILTSQVHKHSEGYGQTAVASAEL